MKVLVLVLLLWTCSAHITLRTKSKTQFLQEKRGLLSSGGSKLLGKSEIQQQQRVVKIAGNAAPISIAKIRLLFFFFYGTLGSCMPFFPVYYRSKGISQDFIGWLGSITPAITFIVSPLWGALADSTGAYRLIMLTTFIISVAGRCAMANEAVASNLSVMGVLVALTAILNAPVKPLMDTAIMASLTDKSDYGKSRLFGQLGFGVGSFAVGPLLSKNVNNMFLLHAALAVPTALLMGTVGSAGRTVRKTQAVTKQEVLQARREKVRVASAVHSALRRPDVTAFFLAVFAVGLASGIIENFAYVRLQEIGGTGQQLGLCRLVSSIAGGPMFWLSGKVSRALGVNMILLLTLGSYVVRFFVYSSISHPLYALPAEALRGVTWASFWACSTYHVYNKVAPSEATATMLSILNGVYGGVGQSLGAIIGGYLAKNYGIQRSFEIAAVGSAVAAGVFGLYMISLRKIATSPDEKRRKV